MTTKSNIVLSSIFSAPEHAALEAHAIAAEQDQSLALESAFLSWMRTDKREQDALLKVFGDASTVIAALANLRGQRWEHVFDSFGSQYQDEECVERMRAKNMFDSIRPVNEKQKAAILEEFGTKEVWVETMLGAEDAQWLQEYIRTHGIHTLLDKDETFEPIDSSVDYSEIDPFSKLSKFRYAVTHGDKELGTEIDITRLPFGVDAQQVREGLYKKPEIIKTFDGSEAEHDAREQGYRIPYLYQQNEDGESEVVRRNGYPLLNVHVVPGPQPTMFRAVLLQDRYDAYQRAINEATNVEDRNLLIFRKKRFHQMFLKFKEEMSGATKRVNTVKIGWKFYYHVVVERFVLDSKLKPTDVVEGFSFITPMPWGDVSPKMKQQLKEEAEKRKEMREANERIGKLTNFDFGIL